MAGSVESTLAIALRNVGYVEGKNNANKFAAQVGHANNQPWCASFVAAVFKAAGVRLPSTSAYTPEMAAGFKREGRWHGTAKVGDVVFFNWTVSGVFRIAHVGIVTKVGRGYVMTVEGNTDEAGGRTGGKVMEKRRASQIAGYGRPEYGTATVSKPVPVLRVGLQGAIKAKYDSLPADVKATIGDPITPELTTPDGRGKYNHFSKGGSIYHSNRGTFVVYGRIRAGWEKLGWEAGLLGYPTNDEHASPEGRRSDFERGVLTYDSKTGATWVHYPVA